MILKQSTPYTRQFLMVKASDHLTGATGQAPIVKLASGTSTGFTATNSPASEVDAGRLPGIYAIVLTASDLAATGDLAFSCSSTSTTTACDVTNFIDQVQTNVFSDLAVNGSAGAGRVYINDSLLKNNSITGWTFMMVDSTTGQRKSGLTVTAQRTLGGGGFAACSNAPTEIGATGIYTINFSAADLNSSVIGFLFTAPGASDLFVNQIPTP